MRNLETSLYEWIINALLIINPPPEPPFTADTTSITADSTAHTADATQI